MLLFIIFYLLGFAVVMSVVSIISAPIYLLIKRVKNDVSMCVIFAIVDAVLTLVACILLLPSIFYNTMDSIIGKTEAIVLIPTMIVYCIGAVVIDRIQNGKKIKEEKEF